MPEKDCADVRARILATVTHYREVDNVKKRHPDAFKNLIEFMDKEFKKDDRADMCDKNNTFIDI